MARHGNKHAKWYERVSVGFVPSNERYIRELQIGHNGSNLIKPGNGSAGKKILVKSDGGRNLSDPICEKNHGAMKSKDCLKPEEIDQRKKLIRECIKEGEYGQALIECKKAAEEIDPKMSDRSLFNEASDCVLAKMRKQDFKNGEDAGNAWMLKAFLEAHFGNYEGALRSYGTAIEKYTGSGNCFVELALAAKADAERMAGAHLGEEHRNAIQLFEQNAAKLIRNADIERTKSGFNLFEL